MTTLPTPQAQRLRPPSWKDTRLVVGVLLVLASIVLGGLAMSAMDDRVGIWAAKGDIVQGDRITEEDLVRVEAHLGEGSADYLRTQDGLPLEAVADRTLRKGELVPRSALVAPGSQEVRSVSVNVDPVTLTNIAKGQVVSVFAADEESSEGSGGTTKGETLEYEMVLDDVTVTHIPEQRGNVLGGSGSRSSVQLLVPKDKVGMVFSLDRKDVPLKIVAKGAVVPGSSG